jgi:hypothetical protein
MTTPAATAAPAETTTEKAAAEETSMAETTAAETTTAETTAEQAPAEETHAPETTAAPLPYEDTLGTPAATDFAWIADVPTGDLTGRFLGNDELVGKWKGEIIYDAGVWELVIITIGTDGRITIEPYQINNGGGWDDETGGELRLFDGEFDVSSIYADGTNGSISLHTFLESYGAQYGVGTFTDSSSGPAKVYMVRP